MTYKSNGFLPATLKNAVEDVNHPDHAEAQRLLASFRNMEVKFYSEIHPLVDAGLAISEVRLARGGTPNIFTLHGCRHVYDLIKALDKFAEHLHANDSPPLSVLESYILLCAAHVHDAANVKKRDSHPERCKELIADRKDLFAGTLERQQIYDVASVHGGEHAEFGKDTIRSLQEDNSSHPRLPLLAALLRIADELSENAERVPELLRRHHLTTSRSYLAYHYASSFQNFALAKDKLTIRYSLYPVHRDFVATVNGDEVRFQEFLEARLDKIDLEARYCSQYGRPALHIGRIEVSIGLYSTPVPGTLEERLSFGWSLYEGYPNSEEEPICKRSPELRGRGFETLVDCLPPTAAIPSPSAPAD